MTTQAAFQSTPPVKAATRTAETLTIYKKISIHAAREGGDEVRGLPARSRGLFQSTPPVKAATVTLTATDKGAGFQSTPPVKAATVAQSAVCRQADISIHAAREGGDWDNIPDDASDAISIHAAREGGDPFQRLLALKHVYFNPRRP